MQDSVDAANRLMVEVFNDIIMLEEIALRVASFKDISVAEVHTVEAIGMYTHLTASEVAKKLKVTAGTLSVAVTHLVKKGYVCRIRSESDRRVVKLGLTNKGRLLYRVHDKFHKDLVYKSIESLEGEEQRVLVSAFSNLHKFLLEKINIDY